MKSWMILAMALATMLASTDVEARHCLFSRNAALMRFRIEKFRRERFASSLNERLERFLASLSELDRAELRDYQRVEPHEKARLLSSLRRQLNAANEGFQASRCAEGTPEWDDDYVSPDTCLVNDLPSGDTPYLHRGLRLFADDHLIFVEASLRDRRKLASIRSIGDFRAGEYFVRVSLGDPADEKACITEAMDAFMSGFAAFEDYAGRYSALSPECLPKTGLVHSGLE